MLTEKSSSGLSLWSLSSNASSPAQRAHNKTIPNFVIHQILWRLSVGMISPYSNMTCMKSSVAFT